MLDTENSKITNNLPSDKRSSLGWPARIENYRQRFGAAYLGDSEGPHLENNWITGRMVHGQQLPEARLLLRCVSG
jgi:hypothetical protein